MEYSLSQENCTICENLLRSSSEQPVDLELTLPDHCPDIERILKCRMEHSITSEIITGSRLDIDGMISVRLYYLDSKKQAIRYYENNTPFSCSFELKRTADDAVCRVRIRNEYLNCRAVSPRRLDIHGAFSVIAAVYSVGNASCCTDIEGDDIRQKKHTETMGVLCGIGQQQFSINEVLDPGAGKSAPESILRSELSISLDDCRAIDDKLMLKGEATLRVLYVTDIRSGAEDHMTFSVPISRVIDVPGINENTVNDISVDVLNSEVSVKSAYDSESTLITLDARLSALVMAYTEKNAEITDDAYSTEHELQLSFGNTPSRRLLGNVRTEASVKGELSADDDGITRIIDLWSDGLSYMTGVQDGKLTVKGKLCFCMLAVNSKGVPFYSERAQDFQIAADASGFPSDSSANTDISICSVSYRIADDKTVEVKADMKLRAAVYKDCTCRTITGCTGLVDRKREKDSTAALTIYYADEGESIWDIARMYCTSPQDICIENNISGDVIQARGMILIPM